MNINHVKSNLDVHKKSMNAKTAKLLNKYAQMFNENPREVKRVWLASNDFDRSKCRKLYKAELLALKTLTK